MEYVDLQRARDSGGLRLVLSPGVPGPWSEAAKVIFHVKGLAYIAVAHRTGVEDSDLYAWSGQYSAPVAAWADEKPRSGWAEILLLAERLAPTPPLIPNGEGERAQMFGICHAICGEDGLGWNRRLFSIEARRAVYAASEEKPPADELLLRKYDKHYTHGAVDIEHARRRIVSVLSYISELADGAARRGSGYLVGDRVSAADLYWTCFSNLVIPIGHDMCPMPDYYRTRFEIDDPKVLGAISSEAIRHRDRVLQRYFKLPMEF